MDILRWFVQDKYDILEWQGPRSRGGGGRGHVPPNIFKIIKELETGSANVAVRRAFGS